MVLERFWGSESELNIQKFYWLPQYCRPDVVTGCRSTAVNVLSRIPTFCRYLVINACRIAGTYMPLQEPHQQNFMAIFTTLIVVIWFSTGTLGIFAHTSLCFYYGCGNMRHTKYSNNSHTSDFHTVL